MFRLKVLCVLLLSPFFIKGQNHRTPNFGANIGLVFHFGTHQQAVGLKVNTYYQQFFYQINLGSQITYRFNDYGNRKLFWESRNALGLLILGGKHKKFTDFEYGESYHNSTYSNALGFAYLWYYDQKKTSQRSGVWTLQTKPLGVLFENDVFGGQAKDRFRTGAISFFHQEETFKIFASFKLWTGETAGTKWVKDKTKHGFKDLSKTLYGKTSNGIFNAGISFQLPYFQTGMFSIGIDDEQIRHVVQNKITHDLIFLPKKIERNTPHYPRLSEEGLPVFEKQEKRKAKPYISMGLNQNWSY